MIKLEKNTFFTADTHFCHNKQFLYAPRNFQTIQEHDQTIIERWNSVVDVYDTVLFLGDLCLMDTQTAISYIQKLNGSIIWIRGNHDTDKKVDLILSACSNIKIIPEYSYVLCAEYKKLHFYCSHYPTLTSNYDEKYFSQHLINLHGHTHQSYNFTNIINPFMYHVGLDSHNCYPIKIDDIIDEIHSNYLELSEVK